MFYAIDQFPMLSEIKDNVDTISEEYNKAKIELNQLKEFLESKDPEFYTHIDYWTRETGVNEEYLGYDSRDGIWAAFPIFKVGFPIKWYDVNLHFPKTIALIKQVDNVFFSGLMRLAPRSGTKPHVHKLSNLIFHIALHDNPKGSELNCGEQTVWFEKKGDYALFDYSVEHSSYNFSETDRIHLTIDFSCSIDRNKLISIDTKLS